ncbi:hypothetical protein M3J09_007549 [Ascochyta lentis]
MRPSNQNPTHASSKKIYPAKISTCWIPLASGTERVHTAAGLIPSQRSRWWKKRKTLFSSLGCLSGWWFGSKG